MRWRATLQYVLAAAASLAVYAVSYQAWNADLRFPMYPLHGDTTLYLATLFKGAIDNPWYSFNRYLGAPTGLDLRDYPMPGLLVHLWIKGLHVFTDDPLLLWNLTFIAGFPVATLLALRALRRLGVRYSVALVASLLFAFASFHHIRGRAHVLYAVGFLTVPLATTLAVDLFVGREIVVARGPRWWRPRLVASRASLAAVAASLVIGLTGAIYFPFFSAALVLVAGLCGALRQRTAWPLARAAVVVGIVCGALAADLAPSLVWVHEHGRTSAVERSPDGAEVYGLKITQLLLPLSNHRVEALRELKAAYDASAPLTNENVTEYLGLFGAIGFLYLTLTLVSGAGSGPAPPMPDEPRDGVDDPAVMHALRMLNVSALLLGTVGGFGAIIAYLVSPQIRGYNRISTYILFCSLAALAIVVERAARRTSRPRVFRFALPAVLIFCLGVGAFDQLPLPDPAYAAAKREFLKSDRLVKAIESSIPKESSVFQLPYHPFPEGGPSGNLIDYDLLEPYIHSRTIHWSHGAMQGRRGDRWNEEMAARPAPEMVEALAEAGFAGILVTRRGYGDDARAVEAALTSLIGNPTIADDDASFYPLAQERAKLRQSLGEADFERRAEQVRTPPFSGWLDGFFPPRVVDDEQWDQCRREGRFVVDNPSSAPRTLVLDTRLRTVNGPGTLEIDGDLLHRTLHTDEDGVPLRAVIDVPPGEHFFRIRTVDGEPAREDRRIYFDMRRPTLQPPEGTASAELGPGFIVPPETNLPLWGGGPRSTVFVRRHDAGHVRLVFDVVASASPEQEVTLRANGGDVGVIRPEEGKAFAVDFEGVAGDNEVTLEFSRWNHHPDEFAPPDPRPFAVAFDKVTYEAGGEVRKLFP